MTLRPCIHEAEIRVLLANGHWPHASSAELRAHIAACRTCGDLVLIAQTFCADRAQAMDAAQLPPPGVLWWRAQLRRRNEAVERIGRPILGAHIFAIAITLLIAGAIVLSQARQGFRWLIELAQAPTFHLSSLWPAPNLDSSKWLSLNWNLPYILPVLALIVLLGGVVVYLASEKQ